MYGVTRFVVLTHSHNCKFVNSIQDKGCFFLNAYVLIRKRYRICNIHSMRSIDIFIGKLPKAPFS